MSRWRRQLKKRHRRAREREEIARLLDGCVHVPTFRDVCEQNDTYRAFMRVINNVGRR